jgi:hypothetical protein
MKNSIFIYALYFITSILFFIAFIFRHPSQLGWASLFCGIVFAVLGLGKFIRMKRK